MKQKTNWVDIQLINTKRQIARLKRLLAQDFLVFSEKAKEKFKEELTTLQELEKHLINQKSKG